MKKWNLWRVSFIGFYCCVIMCTQNISAQEIHRQEKSVLARFNQKNGNLILRLDTNPQIEVFYTTVNTMKRLIFSCYNQYDQATIIIDGSNKFLWGIKAANNRLNIDDSIAQQDLQASISVLEHYIRSLQFKYSFTPFKNDAAKNMYYVKTYMSMLALHVVKEFAHAEVKNKVNGMLQLLKDNLKILDYPAGKEVFDQIVFDEEQKRSFVEYLEEDKTTQEIKLLYPRTYMKTLTKGHRVSLFSSGKAFFISNQAFYNYGNYELSFDIECYTAGVSIKVSTTNAKRITEDLFDISMLSKNYWDTWLKNSALFKEQINNLLSTYALKYDDAITTFTTKTGINTNNFSKTRISDWDKDKKKDEDAIRSAVEQEDKNKLKNALNDKIEKFEQELFTYYWYVYAKKLTLFILQYTLNTSDESNEYAVEKTTLNAEIAKYKSALSAIGEGGLLTRDQEEALANFLLGKTDLKQLDGIFNPSEDQYKQIKEPIKQQTKFERLYSLLPNKYVLGGGLATGLLVWYMLRNYAPTLPKLQKYLMPQWFGKK